MTWAKIVAGLMSLIKPLIYFFVYMKGKAAARSEQREEQARRDAQLAKDYLENREEPRTAEDTKKRIDDGTF